MSFLAYARNDEQGLDPSTLLGMTLLELRNFAKEQNIKNISKLKKDELVTLLKQVAETSKPQEKPKEEENAYNAELRQCRVIGITYKTTAFVQSPNIIQFIFIIKWRIIFPRTITSKCTHARTKWKIIIQNLQ